MRTPSASPPPHAWPSWSSSWRVCDAARRTRTARWGWAWVDVGAESLESHVAGTELSGGAGRLQETRRERKHQPLPVQSGR